MPVILYGAGIAPGARNDAATPADLAVTVASIVGVTLPSPDGHVLTQRSEETLACQLERTPMRLLRNGSCCVSRLAALVLIASSPSPAARRASGSLASIAAGIDAGASPMGHGDRSR